MKDIGVGSLLLRARLGLARIGSVPLAAAVLVALSSGMLVWLLVALPRVEREHELLRERAARAARLAAAGTPAAVAAPAPVLDIAAIGADDAYAHTRSEPLPASARRIRIGDAAATWVHVDAQTGQLIAQMDRSRRAYRWLYTGLHTFDFPLLNRAGGLWRVLMLAALATGLAMSVSALVLGWRRLGRCLRRKPMH